MAKFVFLPLIITKHLTHLMNSFCWIMGVETGKQEIARWTDRLSLSGRWLLSCSNISGAQTRTEMTKNTTDSFVHSAACQIQGQIPAVDGRQETSMDVCERWKPCCFAHWQVTCLGTPWIFHKAPSFLSFLSLEGNQLNLKPLTFTLKDSN